MSAPRDLGGAVVAITGGSRGIGRAAARAFVGAGCHVAIGARDLASAEQVAGELGGACRAYALDVTERASMRAFLDAAERDLGPLAVMVNNAGVLELSARVWEEDDAATRRMVDTNVLGVMHGIKEAVPRLLARGDGQIVNVASTAGKIGVPGGATYSATKHYIVGMSEALRGELRGTGVDVAWVMPGFVHTEMAEGCQDVRFLRRVSADEVAAAIVDAARQRRADVFLPRVADAYHRSMTVLPRVGREAVARFLRADRAFAASDMDAREPYERRAREGAGTDAARGGERLP